MKMNWAAAALIAVLALTGCSTTSPAASTPTPSPTPTPEYATEAEVASVFASHQADWRETIDAAGGCRAVWVFHSSVLDEIKGQTCYLQEQTIGLTAEAALDDLDALEVPPSMMKAVTAVRVPLEGIRSFDLKAICGAGELPVESDDCNSALAGRFAAYNFLDSALDGLSPWM